MKPPPWKVGDLARRTGLSVRALHHYDAVGLLSPSFRTGAGHRLYTEGDVRRLGQVVTLRGIGLSLEEIGECLRDPEFSLVRAVALRIARLDEEIESRRKLRGAWNGSPGPWIRRRGPPPTRSCP